MRMFMHSFSSFDSLARCGLFIVALSLSCANWSVASEPFESPLPERVEFNRDIRPILSDKCFACHGPDKNKREADIRLDTEEGLHGSAGTPGPVKPNDPNASKLIERVETEDMDARMPPRDFGKEITPHERALLRRWIEQGASWEGHWAFQPIRKLPAPVVKEPRFAKFDIDRYIYASAAREGLTLAPEADKRILARRLSFDLTGLPPKPEWVDAFIADESETAYEKLVNQLLESPHFGERMAVWWLDLVRYADSVGYHGDQPMSVTPFRDYVIESFNSNKPFDQFTIEQIAGDLLPNPSTEQLIASGYNRLGMMSAEGGAQAKEYLSKYIAERVRNVSGAWLGVTLGCSECHDHKYDPFSSREFYQMEAFFADIQELGVYDAGRKNEPWGPDIQVPNAEQKQRLSDLTKQIDELKRFLDSPSESLAASQIQWESAQTRWTASDLQSIKSLNGVTLTKQDNGAILASGNSPATDTYELILSNVSNEINSIRVDVLPHDSLPNKGPGRAGNGNFVLSEIEAYWIGDDQNAAEPISFRNAVASYEQVGAAGGNPYGKWAVAAAIDRDAKGATWGWAIMEQAGKPNSAIFQFAEEAPKGNGRQLKVVLKQNLDNPHHTLGHFRVAVGAVSSEINTSTGALAVVPPNVEQILAVHGEKRSADEKEAVAKFYRTIAPELEPTRMKLAQASSELEALNNQIPRTLVTKRVEPRAIRVLPRGNWMDDSGDVVEPGFPSVLGRYSGSQSRLTRLDLAKWIVANENPLTSRVVVNRIWKLFFGAGLSRKLDDLGAQGEWPTHPELLDALANDLLESGWDMKRLIRQIVMTEAYKQSSVSTPIATEKDPYNKWLSHQGRWRLDAEFVRDNALSLSGLLSPMIGHDYGKPYQPRGYWAYLNFPTREWQQGTGEQLYRRGLYTHWQRQYLHPSLLAFDAPGREECVAERTRSNTPLQALVLLNDPIYVEAARAFAERILLSGNTSDEGRIHWAIRQAFSRQVSSEEIIVLSNLLNSYRREYAADGPAAEKLLSVGEFKNDPQVDRIELAAWTGVTRAILNLHETITRN